MVFDYKVLKVSTYWNIEELIWAVLGKWYLESKVSPGWLDPGEFNKFQTLDKVAQIIWRAVKSGEIYSPNINLVPWPDDTKIERLSCSKWLKVHQEAIEQILEPLGVGLPDDLLNIVEKDTSSKFGTLCRRIVNWISPSQKNIDPIAFEQLPKSIPESDALPLIPSISDNSIPEAKQQPLTANNTEPNEDGNVFRWDGDVWIIIHNGKKLPKISDSTRGMGFLNHVLKRRPEGDIIPNAEIESGGCVNPSILGQSDDSDLKDRGAKGKSFGNINEAIDPKTRAAILAEIEKKEDGLTKRIRENDITLDEQEAIEDEIEKLNEYISQNTYRGNIKDLPNDRDRLFDRVRKPIARAIKKIEKHDKALGKMLKDSIKISPSGTQYAPPTGTAPWKS